MLLEKTMNNFEMKKINYFNILRDSCILNITCKLFISSFLQMHGLQTHETYIDVTYSRLCYDMLCRQKQSNIKSFYLFQVRRKQRTQKPTSDVSISSDMYIYELVKYINILVWLNLWELMPFSPFYQHQKSHKQNTRK